MTLGSSLVRLRGRLRDVLEDGAAGEHAAGSRFCEAPFASMYLDQRGDVRACCQNAGFPLGNVASASLIDIWRGRRAQRLRSAIADGDLSLGCNFCRWQTEDGSEAAVFARMFDHLTGAEHEPVWPRQLELSMSNACNLQCVMCNGEWSSSIRTHREGLPPLPKVYGESFFVDLEQFLPHLEVVKFLGGEPFLGAEPLRVMEMLATSAPHVQVHVTTNGTQWTRRIERILERLDVNVVVSLDGVHAGTYESIRAGSSLEAVVSNIDRFVEHANRRGLGFSLSHCLMTSNWHQFDDFLVFAEERGSEVYVNTVTEPYDLSLYHLPPAELAGVLGALRSRDDHVRARLSGPRLAVWVEQLDRLGRHLDLLGEHRPPDYVARHRELGFAWLAPPERAAVATAGLDEAVATGTGWLVELDEEGGVCATTEVGAASAPLAGFVERLIGAGADHELVLDPSVPDDGSVVPDDLHTYRLVLGMPGRADLDLFVTRLALRDADGVLTGVKVFLDEGLRGRCCTWVVPDSADHDAGRAAAALASDPSNLVGLELDEWGMVVSVGGAPEVVLGVGADRLRGRPIDDLTGIVSEGLGRVDGELQEQAASGRIRHQVQRLIAADGESRTSIHVLSESIEAGTRVWLVRCNPTTGDS